MKVKMCDPPSGWKFGFPKPMPEFLFSQQEFYDWLVSEGYPKAMIEKMGESFYCRFWEEELEN